MPRKRGRTQSERNISKRTENHCRFCVHWRNVLAAASHLQIHDATDLCRTYLKASLTVKNFVDILNIPELYFLLSLQKAEKQFILKNFEELAESEQYPLLNDRQLVDILNENGLRVISEFVLFNIVLKWIQHSPDEREQFIADLMKNIRLPLLSGEELVEKVSAVVCLQKQRIITL